MPFRLKFHQFHDAAINISLIYSDSFNFYFLIFTNLIFVFFFCLFVCLFFLLTYFVSPGNSHYCYRGTVEGIFGYVYFCEHIIIEKNILQVQLDKSNLLKMTQ